ncbi:MAG: filamentous hemagglutinin N-terminal domain-containing protein, partial [Caldimonas sp.]
MKTRRRKFAPRPLAAKRAFALHPLCAAALLAMSGAACALPNGATVVAGQATVQNPTPTQQVVTQGSAKAIIDWRGFSIAAGERVRFDQPSSSAVLLNRVTGYDPSSILGQMQSNGRVFLLNPYGVVFGAGARIDVGGLVASSLSLTNADFLAGRYNLGSNDATAPVQRGAVRNDGTISAPNGIVVLAAPQVTNAGTIEANGGRVGLAAANSVLVDVEGDGLVFFQTSAGDATNRLEQLGRIQADGGSIEMHAAARASFADSVLNLSGVVQAKSLGNRNGRIVIDGGDAGVTRVSGQLDASGRAAGESGGVVTLQGAAILVDRSAQIDASGAQGGGSVRIGGDFHGAGTDIRNAQITAIAPGATISADALGNGDGGSVVVWSDHTTRYYGAISARGGSAGGNGGSVEVSGKEILEFRGAVDTRAPHGSNGTLLLDPADIVISASAPLPGDTELNAGQPTAGDAIGLIKFGDGAGTFTISSESLETVAAANNIDLQAKNSITIDDLGNHVLLPGTLTLGTAPGGFARFRTGAGGFSMAAGNSISVANGSLTIDATDPGATGTGAVSVGALSAKGGITLKGTAVTLNDALVVTAAG